MTADQPMEPAGEFLLYQTGDGRTRVECRFADETLWLSQALMAELYQKDVRTINEHLRNIFDEGELSPEATIRKFRIVRREGTREVTRLIEHYNLDAILAVGYRVRSTRGTQFRRWATERLSEYLVKGFTMDDERLKNPPGAGAEAPDYFDELLARIRDIQTERERRQTIGRGLRLCVNQQGERVRGFEVNTLTVVAMESYEQFAENLQKEIEQDTGIRFGVVEPHHFAGLTVPQPDGSTAPLGVEQSKALWEHLKAAGLLDARGKVQDSLRQALKDGTLTVPEPFMPQLDQISAVLKKLAGRLEIRNADERQQVRTRQAVLNSYEFKALWDRIKHKTTYRVQFDNEKLIESCIRAVQEAPPIPKTRLQWRKADIAIGKAGVEATERQGAATVVLDESDIELPDLLTELQDRTQLTRRSIQRILSSSRRLDDFKRNPQAFIELTAEAINRCKRLAVVDGIKYQRLGDEHYYAQELFEQQELTGYLRNLLDATKGVYEKIVYDADTERDFGDQLEKNTAIKVYAKLPGWFTVPTPLGGYNPDWAVLVEEDGGERLYFVVETKSGLFTDDLRDKERAKIECGKAHFNALAVKEAPARYVVARSLEDVLAQRDH